MLFLVHIITYIRKILNSLCINFRFFFLEFLSILKVNVYRVFIYVVQNHRWISFFFKFSIIRNNTILLVKINIIYILLDDVYLVFWLKHTFLQLCAVKIHVLVWLKQILYIICWVQNIFANLWHSKSSFCGFIHTQLFLIHWVLHYIILQVLNSSCLP